MSNTLPFIRGTDTKEKHTLEEIKNDYKKVMEKYHMLRAHTYSICIHISLQIISYPFLDL